VTRWAVVIPTNRPDRFESWLRAWSPLLHKHVADVFVCEDMDPQPLSVVEYDSGLTVHILRRADWPWWVPRGTDMCRSWGMVHAYRSGAEFILSLDDDVTPIGDVFAEYEAVFDAGAVCSPYFDVGALTSFDGQMRGFPYADRSRATVGLQAGGWSGVLDFDARTQLELERTDGYDFARLVVPVPKGAPVTVCAMNMAWRREFTRYLWQLPLLDGRYSRWGDIWGGLCAKRALDDLGVAVVVNGRAQVRHERASDPHANLERETPGVAINERAWESLWDAILDSDPEYAEWFARCLEAWLAEFPDADRF